MSVDKKSECKDNLDNYNFNDIFNDIDSTNSTKKINTCEDIVPILSEKLSEEKNVEADDFLKSSDKEAVNKHNDYYSSFLKEYVCNYKQKNKNQKIMKWAFFILIMILMIAIVTIPLICLFVLVNKNNFNTYNLTAILSALAGAITSFIILPKIIAKHLFPSKEDDKTDTIFKSMIDYDNSLRHFYSKISPHHGKMWDNQK